MNSNGAIHVFEVLSVSRQSRCGFTLIEMMLSLALLALIAGFSAPLYQSFQNQNQLSAAANTMTQTLRRAQILSRANDGDTQWGVYVQTGAITLFRGDDFSGRDMAFDEQFDIPKSLSISGEQEYVFEKLTGLPEETGTVTFVGPADGQRSVSINSEGMVEY